MYALLLAALLTATPADERLRFLHAAPAHGLGNWSMSGGFAHSGTWPYTEGALSIGVADNLDVDLAIGTAFVRHRARLRSELTVLQGPRASLSLSAEWGVEIVMADGLSSLAGDVSVSLSPGLTFTAVVGRVWMSWGAEAPVFFYEGTPTGVRTGLVAATLRPFWALEWPMGPTITGYFRGEVWLYLTEDFSGDSALPGGSTGFTW